MTFKHCFQFAHLIRLSDEEIRVSLQMGGLRGCRRGDRVHHLRPGTRCHSLKTSFIFQFNIGCVAQPVCAVHFSVIHVIPNSVNVSGEMRGVGRQAGTRKATAPPHVKLSWPACHTWQEIAGSGSGSRQPARPVGEDGVPQARNRASPHQRPLAPASLQSRLSPLSLWSTHNT